VARQRGTVAFGQRTNPTTGQRQHPAPLGSVWEIGVKHALGRLPLPHDLTPAEFVPEARSRNGVDTLPITEIDTLTLAKLPDLHQDPFDRMLICQAIANQAVIVTPDPLIARYPISVHW
jgi:PIN domain nuclease of toxin-antitoxin system